MRRDDQNRATGSCDAMEFRHQSHYIRYMLGDVTIGIHADGARRLIPTTAYVKDFRRA